MTDSQLAYLQPTVAPGAGQDPSLPTVQSTDAETTGRTDGGGNPILRQRVATPTVPNEVGTYAYATGASGTVTIPAGARLLSASAWGGGTMKIGTGAAISVPNPGSVNVMPRANLVGGAGLLSTSTVVLTSTTGYFVDWLT